MARKQSPRRSRLYSNRYKYKIPGTDIQGVKAYGTCELFPRMGMIMMNGITYFLPFVPELTSCIYCKQYPFDTCQDQTFPTRKIKIGHPSLMSLPEIKYHVLEYTGIFISNPYLPLDPKCESIVSDSLFSKAACNLPKICGDVVITTIESRWLTGKSYWCQGVGAKAPMSMRYLTNTNIFEIFKYTGRRFFDYPELNTSVVAFDGNYYWHIPREVLDNSWHYENNTWVYKTSLPNIHDNCHPRYSDSVLSDQLRRVLIGDQVLYNFTINGIVAPFSKYLETLPYVKAHTFEYDWEPSTITPPIVQWGGILSSSKHFIIPSLTTKLYPSLCYVPTTAYYESYMVTIAEYIVMLCFTLIQMVTVAIFSLIDSLLSFVINNGLIPFIMCQVVVFYYTKSWYLSFISLVPFLFLCHSIPYLSFLLD